MTCPVLSQEFPAMGRLLNKWWQFRFVRPGGRHIKLTVEALEDRAVPALTLTTPTLDFGPDPVGVLSPSPRATTLLNENPDNVLLTVTPGGARPAGFTLLGGPPVGLPLGTGPQTSRFTF